MPRQKSRSATMYESAFFPYNTASKESNQWFERKNKEQPKSQHIHHAMCGHGGERWIEGWPVDGYCPKTKVEFQYHGCHWHGCPKCFPTNREKMVGEKSREEHYQATLARTQQLKDAGYQVYEIWSCQIDQEENKKMKPPKSETKLYPHTIFYDFESFGDKEQRETPTEMLTIESEHVPISVSVGDTLQREPTHICERDPTVLVRRFMEKLERRAETIRAKVSEEFVPKDLELLPKQQRNNIKN